MARLRPRTHAAAALVAALAYAGSLAVLMCVPDADIIEPLFLLASLGLAFPALAWALTRRPRTTTAPLSRPSSRLGGPPLYLALFSVLVLGWGFGALAAQWPAEPVQSIAKTLVKLATMVALPALLFLRDDRRRPRFGNARLWTIFAVMGVALLAFQAMFGRGLGTLRELAPDATTLAWAIPLCWLWQMLEAGLCEEVLFRRMLQQRLADATGSTPAAVLWASLLFGLAHAPGLVLRGAHLMEGVATATPLWAVAYSIAIHRPRRRGVRRAVGAHALAVAGGGPARHDGSAAAARALPPRLAGLTPPAPGPPPPVAGPVAAVPASACRPKAVCQTGVIANPFDPGTTDSAIQACGRTLTSWIGGGLNEVPA